jgi:hypothetical protein
VPLRFVDRSLHVVAADFTRYVVGCRYIHILDQASALYRFAKRRKREATKNRIQLHKTRPDEHGNLLIVTKKLKTARKVSEEWLLRKT